ncbi:alpha/beta fold hydrolase [Lysobacter sp. A3-1-A15]|uniref:alpha/beta fold hydrolase n=1 Tax=Novilysobacter viscosus TaxID=3098602 RepID=UPI002ED801FF
MREITLDSPFGRLAGWRRDGGGARVLALHGWLDNADSFAPLAAHLPGLDLVAIDMPGHGASAHLPPAADYTMAGFARAGFAMADSLGWDRFDLLAHSLGGAVASVMAAARPERVNRLLLVESLGALAEREDRTAERLRDAFKAFAAPRRPLRVFPDIATAVRARMQANGLSEPVARLLVERGIVPTQDGAGGRGYAWRSDPRLTLPTAIRISESQVRDLVAGIQCPVRVVYANPAPAYFPDVLRHARAGCLQRGEVVVMDGSHHLHMEDPAGVAAAIGDFFGR